MLLGDQLLDSGCAELRVERAKCRTLDVFIFKSGQIETRDRPLTDENALQEWMVQKGAYRKPFATSASGDLVATFRLLCILGFDTDGFKIEPDVFKSIVSRLGLPKSYPADSVEVRKYGRQYVANVTSASGRSSKGGLKMTFISPTFEANRMDITLTYDEANRTTHGVLRVQTASRSPLNELLPTLCKSLEMCAHPLFIPALACNAWYEIMANQYGAVHDEVRDNVQYKTDMMPNYFISEQHRYEDFDLIDQEGLHDQYEQIHQTIVEQHNYLSNGLSYFVEDFSKALRSNLAHTWKFDISTEIQEELSVYIDRLVSKTQVELNHRERLFAKLEMQVQVLYTLMQQRDSRTNLQIAEETKRDSSAMKTLSIVSIVFLPVTAVASVFSMSSFVSIGRDGRLQSSSDFWIYWAVALPLTATLVIAWVVWINRRQLVYRGKKRYYEWLNTRAVPPEPLP